MNKQALLAVMATMFVLGNTQIHGDEFPALDDVDALAYSRDFRIRVNGQEVPVLETVKTTNHGTNNVNRMAFAGFDTCEQAQVLIEIERPFQSFELRPRRSEIEFVHSDTQLSLALDPQQHVVIVFDNDYENSLLISANASVENPTPEEVDHYFSAGIHRLDSRLALRSGDEVFLEEGAIVMGAFDFRDVEDVRVFGRGIIYGGETSHQENYRVFAGDNAKNVTIEGVTICNAPGWIVSFWGDSQDLTVRNVNMVGNFRYNTDGVQTGTRGLVVENCFLQCNDDNFSLNGICTDVEIRNNILWNLYNGGVFMMGWATGQHFQLERLAIHDNTIIRCGGCCDYDRKGPFSMKLFGSRRTAQDIEFRNIVVEDIAAFGRWIDLQANKATDCVIKDIRFENIQIDQAWLVEGEIRGMSETNPIENIQFRNVQIGDVAMTDPESVGLSLIHTSGTQVEDDIFSDIVLTPQPIPESVRHVSTVANNQAQASGQEGAARSSNQQIARFNNSPNHVGNSTFSNGLNDWEIPALSQGRVTLMTVPENDETSETNSTTGGLDAIVDSHWVLVSDRANSDFGISQDITEVLKGLGPGTYQYGVVAKALDHDVHIKATLTLEHRLGREAHPTPDVLLTDEHFSTAVRVQTLTWDQLDRATLKIESGYGDSQDLIIKGVFLNSSRDD